MNANDRAITGYAMLGHGMVHTYELAVPILVTVWLVEFTATPATLGLAVAVGYGLFGVGALPGGVLVDRFGSRTLIAVCLVGMGLSFGLLALAPGVLGIVLALATWGVAASVYHPAGLALISNGVQRRGLAFAYHGMAGNAGIAAGPFLTAILLVVVDWRAAVVVLALPGVLAGLIGLRVDFDERAAVDTATDGGEVPTTEIESIGEFVAASRGVFTLGFVVVLGIVMFNGLYYRGVLTFLPELLSEFLAPFVAGDGGFAFLSAGPATREFELSRYLFTGLLTVGVVGQYLAGRLTDVVQPERGLAVGVAALSIIGVVFVPASGNVWTLLAVSATLGFVLFGIQPFTQATIARYSPPDKRGLSFGYTYLAIFGVGAFGASIIGAVLTHWSTEIAFLVLAGFAVTAFALALVLIGNDLYATPSSR